jgi:hypothetical protein
MLYPTTDPITRRLALGLIAGALLLPTAAAAQPRARTTPTAIVDRDGRLYVFVTDQPTGNVWFKVRGAGFPAPDFSGWRNLGGINAGQRIAAVKAADNRVVAFVRGTDGGIYANWQSARGSTTFNGWSRLWGSTVFATDPVVVMLSNGRLQAFAATASRVLYNSWQTTPTGPFSTSWSSLGTVPINYEPDLAAALSPGGTIVLTAGTKYRTQPGGGGTWSAWRDFSETSYRMDHVSLVASSERLYAFGLDYYCDSSCDVNASYFNESTRRFVDSWEPASNRGVALYAPVAVGAFGTAARAAVLGTDGGIWFEHSGHCPVFGCGSYPWWGAGRPTSATPNPPAMAVTEHFTYLLVSVYNGGTYYKLFWNDDYTLSATWVRL